MRVIRQYVGSTAPSRPDHGPEAARSALELVLKSE